MLTNNIILTISEHHILVQIICLKQRMSHLISKMAQLASHYNSCRFSLFINCGKWPHVEQDFKVVIGPRVHGTKCQQTIQSSCNHETIAMNLRKGHMLYPPVYMFDKVFASFFSSDTQKLAQKINARQLTHTF